MQVQTQITGGFADYRGLNSELLDPNGRPDLEKLKKVIGTNKGIDAANQRNFIQSVDTANTADAHHAIVTNMYQSYLSAAFRDSTVQTRANVGSYYTAKGRQEVYLNPGDEANRNRISLDQNAGTFFLLNKNYRDSHVIFSNEDGGTTFNRVEVNIGPPNDNDPSAEGDDRPADFTAANFGAADHTNVIYIPWLGPRGNTFYALHAAGRNNAEDQAASYLFNVPGVMVNRYVFRWDNGTHNSQADYSAPADVEWRDPGQIWAYLIAYVKLNRIESQFAIVHEIISRTTFYPEAASAEGATYKSSKLTVTLPAPAYFRGKYEPLLKGEPYKTNANGIDLTFSDQTTALKEVIAAGLLNYTSIMGIWATAFEYTLSYESYSIAYAQVISTYPQLTSPHEQMAFGVGAITGRDPYTMFEAGIGVSWDLQDYMIGGLRPWVRESYPDANVDDFVIDGNRLDTSSTFHLPVSPCLLYGKLNGLLSGISHVTDGFTLDGLHADTTLDYNDALKVTNAYRIFGQNITLQQTSGAQDQFSPWSPTHMIGIQPDSIAFDPTYNTHYILIDSVQRENYGKVITGAVDAMHSGKISFAINTTSIKFGMALSGRHAMATIYRKQRTIPNINIRVVAGGQVPVKLAPMPRMHNQPVDQNQGFGEDGQPQPQIPNQVHAAQAEQDGPQEVGDQ
jgi:hypothetical protein